MIEHLQEWIKKNSNERNIEVFYDSENERWICSAASEIGCLYKMYESKVGLENAFNKLCDGFNDLDNQDLAFTMWKCECGNDKVLCIPIAHFEQVIAMPHCMKCGNTDVTHMEYIRKWTPEEIKDLDDSIDKFNNRER